MRREERNGSHEETVPLDCAVAMNSEKTEVNLSNE
jgi:hypothetical protein